MNWSNPLMIWANCLSHLIPMFLITSGCILYLNKSRNFVGVVLLAGNLLAITVNIVSTLFLIGTLNNSISSEVYRRYSMELQAGSILAGLIFGVGFLIMMIDMERKKKPEPEVSKT
jgi:hypothetical protein